MPHQLTSRKEYLEAFFTCKDSNSALITEKRVSNNQDIIILNSWPGFESLATNSHCFYINPLTHKKLDKNNHSLLAKHHIYEWKPYNVSIDQANHLKPSDLEDNCIFPALLQIKADFVEDIDYIKVDTVKQCLSLISIYQEVLSNRAIYPYVYLYAKRKALLFGNEVLSILDYIPETNNRLTLFNSKNSISLAREKLSAREHTTFKIISNLLLFRGPWVLDYFIDIQSNMYLLSYSTCYELDEFKSASSDLHLSHIINKLVQAYVEEV